MEYAIIVLKDVIVTDVRFAGMSNNTQTLVYRFQGTQVETHYWKQMKDGSKGPKSQFGWDVKANVATA